MEVIISVFFLDPLLASSVCRLHQDISSEHLIKGSAGLLSHFPLLPHFLRLRLIIQFCFCLQHTKRKLDDVSKRLEALYDKLRDQKVREICVTCSARLLKVFLTDILNPFALDVVFTFKGLLLVPALTASYFHTCCLLHLWHFAVFWQLEILIKVFVDAINVTTMILLLSFQMSNPILEGLHEIAQGEFVCYGW